MTTYRRMPLAVEVLFTPEGRIKPLRLRFGTAYYDVDKILAVQNYTPTEVPCIAPVEYTLQIAGIHKKIYFEKETLSWFSVKEIIT